MKISLAQKEKNNFFKKVLDKFCKIYLMKNLGRNRKKLKVRL